MAIEMVRNNQMIYSTYNTGKSAVAEAFRRTLIYKNFSK